MGEEEEDGEEREGLKCDL